MLEMILQRMCHSQKNLLIKNERFFIVALETFLVWIQVLTSFLLVFNLLEQLIHVTTGTSRTISGTSK
jgi:hypothetical protein